MDIVKKLIDISASAGCDYVKFQKRNLTTCFSKEELDSYKESPWGTTYREYKEHLEFSREQYNEIDEYCKGKIKWFASPWDTNSLIFLYKYSPEFIKIPSALVTNEHYLRACRLAALKSGCKIIISTGMSDQEMVDKAIDTIGLGIIYCIMHCVSTYPSESKDLNLNCIHTLKAKYPEVKIGFSNHHPGLLGMAVAVAFGAEMLEMHITLDRSMYGSDQAASIEPPGIFKIVKYFKEIELMKGDYEKKIVENEIPIIEKLRRV
jgi:N-acetylneuraminate synthase